MKAVIKYLSLLIFSGLILTFNNNHRLCGPEDLKTTAAPTVVVPDGKADLRAIPSTGMWLK
jgi:hypothetical protein